MLRYSIAVLGAAVLLAGAAAAQASGTNVFVLDTDRVLNTSAVGQHIRERLTVIGTEISTELQGEEATVRTEVERFNTDTADQTEEQIAANEALSTRRAELQNRVIQLGVSEQIKQRELEATRQAALEPVHAALSAVLEEIVEEKSADVLVERSLLIFVSPDSGTDITNEVIEKLNTRLSTVAVERVRLPVAQEGGGEE
jgi:outer membrane protein